MGRGEKFDWMFETWRKAGLADRLLAVVQLDNPSLLKSIQTNRNHDERAALVCLLTALCKVTRHYVQVDDPLGGGFVLPPRDLWQDWARRGLDDEARRLSEIRIADG